MNAGASAVAISPVTEWAVMVSPVQHQEGATWVVLAGN
jgi:hypothetical protein